jgi:hypothetical protein
MNLLDVNSILAFWIGKKLPSFTLSKGEFERLLHLAQLKHLNKKIGLTSEYLPGQPIPRQALEITTRITMDIQKLKKEKDINIGVGGFADLPIDFYFPSSLTVKLIRGTDIKYRNVDFESDKVFSEKIGSFINKPSKYFPIATITGDHAKINPTGFKYAHLTYISIPTKPVYGVSHHRGFAEYVSATSTELQWDDTNIIDIMIIALGEIGISVTSGELVQISDKSKNTGQ